MIRLNKRGLTAVVSTVLLIAIVVVVVAIIFAWSKSFIHESLQKRGLPVEQACEKINIQKSCSGGIVSVTNLGNVPIYQFDIKKVLKERTTLQHSNEDIGIGESVEVFLGAECPSEYKIVPAVLSSSSDANKIYTCTKNEF